MAAAGSSTLSSYSSASLELRELFLTNEPTTSKNSAPQQQPGAKCETELWIVFTTWSPETGLPGQVTYSKTVWGSKCEDWWKKAISSRLLWYQPPQRALM